MKGKIFIIIGIMFIVLSSIGFYFYFRGGRSDSLPPEISSTTPPRFFGFGSQDNQPLPQVDSQDASSTTSSDDFTDNDIPLPLSIFAISSEPIAGATFMTQGTSSLIRFVEKKTGHIFQYNPTTQTSERISNITIPRVQKALWGNRGNTLIAQYLEDDNETLVSYVRNIVENENGATTTGFFLPQNIESITPSLESEDIFYVSRLFPGSRGVVINSLSSEEQVVFESPLAEWRSSWDSSRRITLFSKPSALARGIVMFLSGTSETVLPNSFLEGVSALGNTLGTASLVGSVDNNNTVVLQVMSNAGAVVKDIPFNTFPEKCFWGSETELYCAVPRFIQDGLTLPDAWYQGKITFNDSIWKFDIDTGLAQFIVTPENNGLGMDVINLLVSKDQAFLIFQDKKTNLLWQVNLVDESIVS